MTDSKTRQVQCSVKEEAGAALQDCMGRIKRTVSSPSVLIHPRPIPKLFMQLSVLGALQHDLPQTCVGLNYKPIASVLLFGSYYLMHSMTCSICLASKQARAVGLLFICCAHLSNQPTVVPPDTGTGAKPGCCWQDCILARRPAPAAGVCWTSALQQDSQMPAAA